MNKWCLKINPQIFNCFLWIFYQPCFFSDSSDESLNLTQVHLKDSKTSMKPYENVSRLNFKWKECWKKKVISSSHGSKLRSLSVLEWTDVKIIFKGPPPQHSQLLYFMMNVLECNNKHNQFPASVGAGFYNQSEPIAGKLPGRWGINLVGSQALLSEECKVQVMSSKCTRQWLHFDVPSMCSMPKVGLCGGLWHKLNFLTLWNRENVFVFLMDF